MTESHSKDTLSFLPEPILVDILSLLPLKSAIVTSLLSRQWRYLWTQVTSFNVIDNSYLDESIKILAYDKKFNQLIINSPSIISLEIDLSSRTSREGWIRSIIESWVIEVCARNVERIKLSMVPPPCVFVTKSIIELDFQCLSLLPDDIDLPNLKKLSISRSTLQDESFKTSFLNFINSCSLLKDLSLNIDIDVQGRRGFDVEIRLSDLKRLDIELGRFFGVCVIDAPNLEYLSVRNRVKFRLVRFPNALRSLQLDLVPCEPPQEMFSYLTCLNVNFKAWEFDGLMKFLKFCPVLKIIKLKMNTWYCEDADRELCDWPIWRIAQFQINMKKIEIEFEKGGWVLKYEEHVVKMVEHLVRSVSKDLKQLTLRVSIYECQATSFSTLGNNLAKCLVEVRNPSKYEMDSSNTAYWSFKACF